MTLRGLQLDLATAILRIEQAHADPDMAEHLLFRLATCDAPRLRRYLDAETVTEMNTISPEPSPEPSTSGDPNG